MPVTVENAADLRKAYLRVFANFSVSVSDLADDIPEFNTRYARELLGALQHGGLLALTEDGEGSEAYQVSNPGTYDDHTVEEAEAVIDEWLGVKAPPNPSNATSSQGSRTSPAKSTTTEAHECLCGCSEVIRTRALYRPGHDARHAGQIGRAVANLLTSAPNGVITAKEKVEADELIAQLPTPALRDKAFRIRDNHMAKSKARPAHSYVEGIVTVGKTEFVGRRNNDGSTEYLDGKGNWKPASKTAARTFQEG